MSKALNVGEKHVRAKMRTSSGGNNRKKMTYEKFKRS